MSEDHDNTEGGEQSPLSECDKHRTNLFVLVSVCLLIATASLLIRLVNWILGREHDIILPIRGVRTNDNE